MKNKRLYRGYPWPLNFETTFLNFLPWCDYARLNSPVLSWFVQRYHLIYKNDNSQETLYNVSSSGFGNQYIFLDISSVMHLSGQARVSKGDKLKIESANNIWKEGSRVYFIPFY